MFSAGILNFFIFLS